MPDALDAILPASIANVAKRSGNEWVLPLEQAIQTIKLASDNGIAILGVESFRIEEGGFVDHPNLIRELDSINNAKGITAVREGDLQHARTEPVKGFGDVRFPSFRRDRQRAQEYSFGTLGKLLEVFECRLDPRDGPGFSRLGQLYFMLSYLTTCRQLLLSRQRWVTRASRPRPAPPNSDIETRGGWDIGPPPSGLR